MKHETTQNKQLQSQAWQAITISLVVAFGALILALLQSQAGLVIAGIIILAASIRGLWSVLRLERHSIPLAQLLGVGILSLIMITGVIIIINGLN